MDPLIHRISAWDHLPLQVRQWNAHRDPHRDTHLDAQHEAHRDTQHDAQHEAHSDTQHDAHRDTHSDAHRNNHHDTHGDTHRDIHGDAYRETNRDAHRDNHRDTHGDTHRDTHGDAYREASGDTHRDARGDAQPDAQPDARCDADRRAGHPKPPVLCLPGLVRTGADFDALAAEIGRDRRVVTLDYPGRGDSGRSRDVNRYAPEACLRDVMDVCAALHIHRAVIIGTSFGGLLAMGLAAAKPSLVHAVVLNDIGPDIAGDGADFVRDFVAHDPALPSLDACVALLRASLPPMSLHSDAAWRHMAELTYRVGAGGRWHPNWDTAIAKLLNRPPPDLWPLFGALTDLPVLLVRGAVSNILLPGTVSRMQAVHPDMEVVSLPGIGHAPILTEPPVLAAIRDFLARNP